MQKIFFTKSRFTTDYMIK